MPDWYLGQAGFGEQIQLYGETFWRQLGSTLLWTFLAVWIVLMFVAIVVGLSRRAEVNRELGGAPGIDRGPRAAPSRALVVYTGGSQRRLSPPPEEKAPPKVA